MKKAHIYAVLRMWEGKKNVIDEERKSNRSRKIKIQKWKDWHFKEYLRNGKIHFQNGKKEKSEMEKLAPEVETLAP